jgi:hypothetical protein
LEVIADRREWRFWNKWDLVWRIGFGSEEGIGNRESGVGRDSGGGREAGIGIGTWGMGLYGAGSGVGSGQWSRE